MNKLDLLAPVALFVYNRPLHTRVLLESLLENKESENTNLFVFSDAAKDKSQLEFVEDVRKVISDVKGFKSITIIKQKENLGLAKSVIGGVTQLCNEHGRVIVLEDDLVLSPYFLNYMNAALDLYKDEDNVMQISGHMFPVSLNLDQDAIFLPFISTWGWATWKHSWDKFDPDMKGYNKLKTNRSLRRKFDIDGAYPYFKMLEKQRQGKVDSWGIRWNLSVFENSGLVLYPVISLVDNAGFDGSGTHCSYRFEKSADKLLADNKLNKFPEVINQDEFAYMAIRSHLRSSSKFVTKLLEKFLSIFH